MTHDDFLDLLKKVPNPENYAEYERELNEHIKKNNFSLYDAELADARKDLGYYYMEINFFSDLFSIARKYISDLPDIEFIPRRWNDFNVMLEKYNGKNIIFADELMLMFLNSFSCGAFYMSMKASTIKDRKALNRMLVSLIDIFACRNKDNIAQDLLTIFTENDHSTKFACFMARAMYSFLLCHEIAHLALQHSNVSWENEFDADALGYEIFYSAILNHENLKHLEFFDSLRRAPLALFDILDTLEYFKSVIHDHKGSPLTHPEPSLRKAALLDQFDFGDNEECFNLYLVISERAAALKYYIHKYRDVMKEEIKKIHMSDAT